MIFFGEIELFYLRGFVKDWCQADEDPKMRLLWQRKARNALGGSNMGSTEPLAGDIALELLDNKLLLIDDRFYEISNGDYAAYLACFHDR